MIGDGEKVWQSILSKCQLNRVVYLGLNDYFSILYIKAPSLVVEDIFNDQNYLSASKSLFSNWDGRFSWVIMSVPAC